MTDRILNVSAERDVGAPEAEDARKHARLRLFVFLGIFLLVAAAGLTYDFSRTAVYRATARLSVDPPYAVDDPFAKAQFALTEAQFLRRSDLALTVAGRLHGGTAAADADAAALERQLTVEALPQTNVIEMRAEGPNKDRLTEALTAWLDAYIASRRQSDENDNTESLAEAKHAAAAAQRAVEDKQREMESFRQRYGVTSTERDENRSAARIKGLLTSLNDAATREVNAEAKVKAVNEAIAEGRGVIRPSDSNAINNMEMRAVDLRESMKSLEHDYTAQYLSMDPKYKALKANLARIEAQIQQEKERSQKAALLEAQEEYASAQRAAQRIREQVESIKQESQAFAARFIELKRMAADLDQLQETRRLALERASKLQSAQKPAAVKVAVLSAPAALPDPIAPDFLRDGLMAIAAALVLAIAGVWLLDYLRRRPDSEAPAGAQPIIQIAYPGQAIAGPAKEAIASRPAALLGTASGSGSSPELSAEEIQALWAAGDADGRLVVAALLAGISPVELTQLRLKHVRLEEGYIDIPGGSARRLPIRGPVKQELASRLRSDAGAEAPLLANGSGEPLEEADIDGLLACMAHDAGLRHPEDVTGMALHFTYAAFLARQGMKMSDLAGLVGRLRGALGAELMRLSPPGRGKSAQQVEFVYPAFRTA